MAEHVRVTEWAARVLSTAIDMVIPDEESVRWDVSVVPNDLETPRDPQIALWMSIDEPDGVTMQSTYVASLFDLEIDDITSHVQQAWDVCVVERMEMELRSLE